MTDATRDNPASNQRLFVAVFVLGAYAVVVQSVLLREFLVLSFGAELSWGITFFGWLLGIAVGAAAGGRVCRNRSDVAQPPSAGTAARTGGGSGDPPPLNNERLAGLPTRQQETKKSQAGAPVPHEAKAFAVAVAALAVLTPVCLYLIRIARGFFNVGPGEYLSLWTMLWLYPLLTAPISFVVGFTFPLASALAANGRGAQVPALQGTDVARPPVEREEENGKTLADKPPVAQIGTDTIAKVYAVEAAGSIVGGMLFSFVLVEIIPAFTIIGAAGMFILLGAGLLFPVSSSAIQNPKSKIQNWAFAIAAVLFGFLTLYYSVPIERASVESRWKTFKTGTELERSADSRYENIVLAQRENEYSVFLDGLKAMTFPDPKTHALDAHFVMCEAHDDWNILVIGAGLEGIISEMLKYPVQHLDYVTLDPGLVGILREKLPPADAAALKDPRVSVHFDDGRHFLQQSRGNYSLIYLEVPEPSSLMLNRFYTREFFALACSRLHCGGLLAFKLTASPSYFSEMRRKYLGCIRNALDLCYCHTFATWGDRSFFLTTPGDNSIFTADGAELVRRYRERGVKSENFDPAWFEGGSDMLTPANLAHIKSEIDLGARDTAANSDARPVAALYNLILWDRVVGSREHSAFEWLASVNPWTIVAALAGATLLWLAFARAALRRSFAESATLYSVATTGLASMAFELVLLVVFQSLYGYVYARIGIIVGVFFLGLAVGSLGMKRILRARPAAGLRMLAGLDLAVAAFALTLAIATPELFAAGGASAGFIEGCVTAMVLVAGVLGGAVFPLAAKVLLDRGRETGRAAGSVDAADNVGACIGALVVGVVLVSALGIVRTCLVLVLMKHLSAGLVLSAARRSKTLADKPPVAHVIPPI